MAESYTQLQTDVNTLARRTVDTISYKLLTNELNARLRLTLMESTSSITVNAESEALPADFLEARALYLDASPRIPIEIVSEFTKTAEFASSGRPAQALITDGNILFNAVPDGEYTVQLRYIASLANLSGGSDTNAVMDAHYQIYVYGALKHWTQITRDRDEMAHWTVMFEQAIDQAEKADNRKRWGAGPLRSHAVGVA